MPEHITIESEPTEDPDVVLVLTNLSLTAAGEVESYDSPQQGEEGSPLAQALYMIDGLLTLRLEGSEMLARRAPGVQWHDLLEEIRAALVDFYL